MEFILYAKHKKNRKSSFVDALKELGVQKGDNCYPLDLLRLEPSVRRPNMYLNSLSDLVGEMGTLMSPTFTFSFINTKKYDFRKTKPINMGFIGDQLLVRPDHFVQNTL